ncbi:hypothetical protein ABH947_001842 [Bacillus sp. RC206]
MENVYKGPRHTGFTMLLIFGGVFLLRWFIHDEMLLDQLIGFSIGMVMVIYQCSFKSIVKNCR